MCFRCVIIHTATYYIFVFYVQSYHPETPFFFGLFQYARHELHRLFTYHSRYNILQTGARILRKHTYGKRVYYGGRETNFYWVTGRFLFSCKRAISHIAQPSGEYKRTILTPNYTQCGREKRVRVRHKGVAHRRAIILYT